MLTTTSVRVDAAGERVTRNTLWNMLGSLLPIPAALVCIPVLATTLGLERFGALGVAWMILAYFGLFDFGLSQGTTRFAAAEIAHGRYDVLRSFLFSSLVLHTALGLAGGVILAALAPWLANDVFTMSEALSAETEIALYWLAASVPAIVITAAFRGMLEGLQRFDLVNLIRIPGAIVNYVGPVIALPFGETLPVVVAVIVIARFAVLIAYGIACVLVTPGGPGGFDSSKARQLAVFGGWLSVSNLFNPLMIATDRFIIASAISVAAVAFYITPFEIITKAWILSASLMGALFPVLATLAENQSRSLRATCRTAEVYLVALAAPAIALVLGCADWLLGWWLGPEFRDGSTTVARLLGVGILINIVAQVPLTALHAVGRADITAKIVAVQLPVYIAAIWFSAIRFGINGVAAVWAVRTVVDAVLLYTAANKVLPQCDGSERNARVKNSKLATVCLFLGAFWLVAFLWQEDAMWRGAAIALLFPLFFLWEWCYLLRPLDREYVAMLCRRVTGSRIE